MMNTKRLPHVVVAPALATGPRAKTVISILNDLRGAVARERGVPLASIRVEVSVEESRLLKAKRLHSVAAY